MGNVLEHSQSMKLKLKERQLDFEPHFYKKKLVKHFKISKLI